MPNWSFSDPAIDSMAGSEKLQFSTNLRHGTLGLGMYGIRLILSESCAVHVLPAYFSEALGGAAILRTTRSYLPVVNIGNVDSF